MIHFPLGHTNTINSVALAGVTSVKRQTREQFQESAPEFKAGIKSDESYLQKVTFQVGQTDSGNPYVYATACGTHGQVREADQPTLFALLRRLCEELKAPFPYRAHLSPESCRMPCGWIRCTSVAVQGAPGPREGQSPPVSSANNNPIFFQLVLRTRAPVKGDRHVRFSSPATGCLAREKSHLH